MTGIDGMDTSCGECGSMEGKPHVLGCQKEACPFCGKGLVSCLCYSHFKLENETCPFCKEKVASCQCSVAVVFETLDERNELFNELTMVLESNPRDAIAMMERAGRNGNDRARYEYITLLDTIQYDDDAWIAKLEGKGRVPHVFTPNLCIRCGKVDPDFFMVPDDEWRAVIPIHLRKKIFCMACYEHVRDGVGYEGGVNVEDHVLFGKAWNERAMKTGITGGDDDHDELAGI